MRKLAAICLLLTIPSCAIGKLEDAAEALEEAEKTLDELDIAGCMDTCSAAAETCLEEANGPCVDACEFEEDVCSSQEDTCIDQQKTSCAYLDGPAYTQCMENVYDTCDMCCDDISSDCNQDCGEQAQDCLFGEPADGSQNYSDCVAACIKELEDDLKGIDL